MKLSDFSLMTALGWGSRDEGYPMSFDSTLDPGTKPPRPKLSRAARAGFRVRWLWLCCLAGSFALCFAAVWAYRPFEAEPEAIWKLAQVEIRAGRFDRAGSAVDRLSRLREPTPMDWMLRAQLAMARGHNDEALAALARVADDHFMAPQARLTAGQIEQRRGRARLAEAAFLSALRLDPTLVQAHRELIYIYALQLRIPEIDAEFEGLSKLTELTYANVFHWCLIRNLAWEVGDAAEALGRFVASDPEDRQSRLALAENQRRLGLPREAEETLAVLPQADSEVIAIRAALELDRQATDQAEHLLALGRLDDPILAELRGRIALARHDPATALCHFRVAHSARPQHRDTVVGLIDALTLLGDVNAATAARETLNKLERFNTLIQRASNPYERNNPQLLQGLGAACAEFGRNTEARAWYRLAIAHDPLDQESQRALFRLEPQRHRPQSENTEER
jgi:tetratricopeptide (TPR) repeat protein